MPLAAPLTHSAQDLVLRLPELLSCIFEQSEKATQAAGARVCRDWEVPALSALWYRPARPEALFSLLGRTVDTGTRGMVSDALIPDILHAFSFSIPTTCSFSVSQSGWRTGPDSLDMRIGFASLMWWTRTLANQSRICCHPPYWLRRCMEPNASSHHSSPSNFGTALAWPTVKCSPPSLSCRRAFNACTSTSTV